MTKRNLLSVALGIIFFGVILVIVESSHHQDAQAQCSPYSRALGYHSLQPGEIAALKGRYRIVGEWFIDTATGRVNKVQDVYDQQHPKEPATE